MTLTTAVENGMVVGAQAAWDALCEAEAPQDAVGDILYRRMADSKAFPYWDELEQYALMELTLPMRAEIFLGITGHRLGAALEFADMERLKLMLNFATIADRAAYRDELWRWMMDDARQEFVDWLLERGAA